MLHPLDVVASAELLAYAAHHDWVFRAEDPTIRDRVQLPIGRDRPARAIDNGLRVALCFPRLRHRQLTEQYAPRPIRGDGRLIAHAFGLAALVGLCLLPRLVIRIDCFRLGGGGTQHVEAGAERVDIRGGSHVYGEGTLRLAVVSRWMEVTLDQTGIVHFHEALVAVAFGELLEKRDVGAALRQGVVALLPRPVGRLYDRGELVTRIGENC